MKIYYLKYTLLKGFKIMPKIVLIGGGSSSGKTFITKEALKKLGRENFTFISFDDYYKDISNLSIEERKKENFDHPSAFDWPLILEQISKLKVGESINKPVYDFNILTRTNKTEVVKPKNVVIFEGIMALENSKLRKMADLKIFVAASPEKRFLRRLIRDHSERTNRPYDFIIDQYFSTVKPMYDEFVKPTQFYADTIIYNEDDAKKTSRAINILTVLLNAVLHDKEYPSF